MPEHEDLELLRSLRSAQQHDQLNQATERRVDERPNHARPPELGEGEGIDPPAKPTGQTANRVSEPHAITCSPPRLSRRGCGGVWRSIRLSGTPSATIARLSPRSRSESPSK